MIEVADRGFRHAFRGPLNAWLLIALDRYMHAKYGERKRVLFAGGPDDVIVELGPGTGANLRYFGRGARVVAIEPNRAMHARLQEAAARRGIQIDVRAASAEATGLPDASADLVVASLVLCTVPDPQGAVAEARRILKPGGRFVCLEHVRAPPGTAEHRLQRLLRRPWRWMKAATSAATPGASPPRSRRFASDESSAPGGIIRRARGPYEMDPTAAIAVLAAAYAVLFALESAFPLRRARAGLLPRLGVNAAISITATCACPRPSRGGSMRCWSLRGCTASIIRTVAGIPIPI